MNALQAGVGDLNVFQNSVIHGGALLVAQKDCRLLVGKMGALKQKGRIILGGNARLPRPSDKHVGENTMGAGEINTPLVSIPDIAISSVDLRVLQGCDTGDRNSLGVR